MTALHLVPAADAELDALEHAVDAGLAAAIDALAALRQRQAHTARGYTTWGEYLFARFGEALRRLRLDRDDRLAVVDYLAQPHGERDKPMPLRQIADTLGIAVNTVQGDKEALGLRVVKAKPEPLPAPAGKKYEQALEWLRRSPDGLTLEELTKATGWREGSASGALSYLTERRMAVRSEDKRANQRIHYATEVEQ